MACTFAVVARRDLLRSMARDALTRVVARAASAVDAERHSRRNVDAIVAACLSANDSVMRLGDAGRTVAFLRECLEPTTFDCQWLRRDRATGDQAVTRFEMLVANWLSGVAPIPVAEAWQLALEADAAASRRDPYEEGRWTGDVGLHFLASSTTGRKGRLLASAVRFMGARCCVEIGTAYGMSALFILSALAADSEGGALHTIECLEPQHSLAAATLKRLHPERATCHFGKSGDVLPALLAGIGDVDLVFHDGEHSEAAYVSDFEALEPALASGAVVVYDDLHWDDRAFTDVPPRTYEGWQSLVGHRRVRSAVEVDGATGVLLLT